MSTPRKVVRLADLIKELDSVELPGGRVSKVNHIDGIAMQLQQELQASGNPMLLWEIAARCLPDASREEVYALTLEQATRVVEIASGVATAVLEEIKNDLGAATATRVDAPPTQ